MSYCHIRLKKILSDKNVVKYQILSPDFNEDFEWEYFGILELDTDRRSYRHYDNELWIRNMIYPIDLGEVPVDKRKELTKGRYKDYSSFSWTQKVFDFILTFS